MNLRVSIAFRRAYFVVAFGVACCTVAFAQKTFSFPHVLETSGRIAGIGWNLTGGQFTVDTMPPTLDRVYTTYEPIEALFSLYDNNDVLQWVVDNINGIPTTRTYSIYSLQKGARFEMTAYDMIPSNITFPGCDADSKDPAGLHIRMLTSQRELNEKLRTPSETKVASDVAKKQKMFLPSNFRLTMGDLPCSRVSKVESFSIRQRVADTDGDGKPEVDYVLDDIIFDVPAADGAAFQDAFKATLAGTPKYQPLRLDYLDGDGNVLLSVQITCAVVGVGATNVFADPNDPGATLQIHTDKKTGHVTVVK